MNNKELELIGESIWNTYRSMAHTLLEFTKFVPGDRRRGQTQRVERAKGAEGGETPHQTYARLKKLKLVGQEQDINPYAPAAK